MDWLMKISGLVPVRYRKLLAAVMVGLFAGGLSAEAFGIRSNVSNNTVEVVKLNQSLNGVNGRLDDVISVLCFMALEDGHSPLTCLPGGRK